MSRPWESFFGRRELPPSPVLAVKMGDFACEPLVLLDQRRVRGGLAVHDASAPEPRARPHRVASAMLQDATKRALRTGAGRRAAPTPSHAQPREGSGPCIRPRIDAAAPSPVRPDRADLELSPPPLVVQSSFRSPSAWLLALSSHGDKAGVSPIIDAEGCSQPSPGTCAFRGSRFKDVCGEATESPPFYLFYPFYPSFRPF